MAWLTDGINTGSFKLGRPGYEVAFELRPEAIAISPLPIAALQSNLAGDLRKSALKADAPRIRINNSYLSVDQTNKLVTMAGWFDTFLSLRVRDDLQRVLDYALPLTTTTVQLPGSSALRLGAALVAAGFASSVTIVGVYTTKDGSGTNYFTGGAYDDASRTVTLGTALPNATQPVYITYSYTGWLVNLRAADHNAARGQDGFAYSFTLEGA
jgi:hypothetical protein